MFVFLSMKAIKRFFKIRSLVFTLTGVQPRVSDLLSSIILSVDLAKLHEAFCDAEEAAGDIF